MLTPVLDLNSMQFKDCSDEYAYTMEGVLDEFAEMELMLPHTLDELRANKIEKWCRSNNADFAVRVNGFIVWEPETY